MSHKALRMNINEPRRMKWSKLKFIFTNASVKKLSASDNDNAIINISCEWYGGEAAED